MTMPNAYSDSNPYSAPSVGEQVGDAAAVSSMVDPSTGMADSSQNGFGGDSSGMTPGEQIASGTATAKYVSACLDCGITSKRAKVSHASRCSCGSDNLIYEAVASPTPQISEREYEKMLYSPMVYQAGLTIPEILAAQAALKTAEFPPKDNDKEGEDDEEQDDQEDNGTSGPSDGPPVGEPEPSNGADPQNPSKEAPPVEQDPAMEDPNAAVAPVPGQEAAAPVSTDPMDRAQATLEAQVEAVNQLGHDAMETAYDVDELFSEWRCMNCELEGRGDISEDGQVAFSGDLLQEPQGCTAPQMGAVPPVAPVEGQNPAVEGEIPVQDQEITQGVQARKRKFIRNPFRRTADAQNEEERELNNDRSSMSADSHNEPDETSPAESNTDDDLEAIAMMTRAILATNPGMKPKVAADYARATVRRFPSVVR